MPKFTVVYSLTCDGSMVVDAEDQEDANGIVKLMPVDRLINGLEYDDPYEGHAVEIIESFDEWEDEDGI